MRNTEKKFIIRNEVRLVISKVKFKDILLLFKGEGFRSNSYYEKSKSKNDYLTTVYFGLLSGKATQIILRLRLYQQSKSPEVIVLRNNEVAVLELKVGKKSSVRTRKQKETVIVGELLDTLNNPGHLVKSFEDMRKKIIIPPSYPTSHIDISLIQKNFEKDNYKDIVPIFATQSRRIYYSQEGKQLNLSSIRVAIDKKKKYFIFVGFPKQLRNKAYYITDESEIRFDVKFGLNINKTIVKSLIHKLAALGAEEAVPTHKIGRNLYLKYKKKTMFKYGYLIDEIPGKELEVKMNVIVGSAEFILKRLKNDLIKMKIPNFTVLPELRELLRHEGNIFCYGFRTKKGMIEALAIVEDKNGWHVRIKDSPRIYQKDLLIRNISSKHVGILSNQEKDMLINEVGKNMNQKLEIIGSFVKKKATLSLLNTITGRQYVVTSGECIAENGKILSQIEMERYCLR